MSNELLRGGVIDQASLVDAVITFVPNAGAAFVERMDGSEELLLINSQRATRFSSALAAMYMGVGPGLHHEARVHENSGLISSSFQPNLVLMAEGIVPGDIAQVIQSDVGTIVEFGRFAIASRKATEADKERVKAEVDLLNKQQFAELEAIESTRTNFATHDHAIIEVDGANFYLPFNASSAILVARVMQYLGTLSRWDTITQTRVATEVWKAMPLAERGIFCTEAQLGGGSSPIQKHIANILNSITNPLGATRRGTGHYTVTAEDIVVDVKATPPTDFPERTRPVFVPGAPREDEPVQESAINAIEPAAREVLTIVAESEGLSHEQAIAVLEVIMRQEGKIALADILAEQDTTENIEELIDRLHARVERTLGWSSYYEARRARTPFGGHATGKGGVQQVGGGLNPARTKYLIGNYSETVALRRQPTLPKSQTRPPV